MTGDLAGGEDPGGSRRVLTATDTEDAAHRIESPLCGGSLRQCEAPASRRGDYRAVSRHAHGRHD